jgi:hypothetical protein
LTEYITIIFCSLPAHKSLGEIILHQSENSTFAPLINNAKKTKHMKKQVLLLFLSGFMSAGIFAQSVPSSAVTGKDPVIVTVPVLKKLSDKVNEAYVKTQTVSRSNGASVQTDYNTQLDAYLLELQNQLKLNTADKALTKVIETEISTVKELRSPSKTSK